MPATDEELKNARPVIKSAFSLEDQKQFFSVPALETVTFEMQGGSTSL